MRTRFGDGGDHARPLLRLQTPQFVVEGLKTTIPLHQQIVRDEDFLAGDYTIKWLEDWLARQDAEAKA